MKEINFNEIKPEEHMEKFFENIARRMTHEELIKEHVYSAMFHIARTDQLKEEFESLKKKFGKCPELRRLWNVIQSREPEDNGLYFTQEDAEEWGIEWKEPDSMEEE